MTKSIYTIDMAHFARVCNQLRRGGFTITHNAYWTRIYKRGDLEIIVNR